MNQLVRSANELLSFVKCAILAREALNRDLVVELEELVEELQQQIQVSSHGYEALRQQKGHIEARYKQMLFDQDGPYKERYLIADDERRIAEKKVALLMRENHDLKQRLWETAGEGVDEELPTTTSLDECPNCQGQHLTWILESTYECRYCGTSFQISRS